MSEISSLVVSKEFEEYNYIFLDIIFQRYVRLTSGKQNALSVKEIVEIDDMLYDEFIGSLLIIIIRHKIPVKALTLDELISISGVAPFINISLAHSAKLNKNTSFCMNVGNDDILIYNLIKSIYLFDCKLLNNLQYGTVENNLGLIDFLHYNKDEYKSLAKKIRTIKLEESGNLDKIEEDAESSLYNCYSRYVLEALKITIFDNKIYGDNMIMYNKKLFTSRLLTLTIYSFGKILEILNIEPETNVLNVSASNINKYACFFVSEVCKAFHNRIYGKFSRGNPLESYNHYTSKFLERNKHLWESELCGSTTESIHEDNDQVRELKYTIKDLKRELYCLRKTHSLKDYSDTIVKIEEKPQEHLEEEETVPINTSLSREDKIRLLEENSVIIYGNSEIFGDTLATVNFRDTNKFKGKSIPDKYRYVVKLTKGIDHAIGYDLDSEIGKINAKLITCSRTNIDLILDSILSQIGVLK